MLWWLWFGKSIDRMPARDHEHKNGRALLANLSGEGETHSTVLEEHEGRFLSFPTG